MIDRFDLRNNIQPLNRCLECNGLIKIVIKEDIEHLLKPKTRKYFNDFFQYTNCNKVYWEGSHFQKIMEQINNLQNSAKGIPLG